MPSFACACTVIAAAAVTATAAAATTTVAAAADFLPLGGLAATEGSTLAGPFLNCGIDCCKRRCLGHGGCNSFSLNARAKVCFLKDHCVREADPVARSGTASRKYTTWYSLDCGTKITPVEETAATTSVPQKQDSQQPLDQAARRKLREQEVKRQREIRQERQMHEHNVQPHPQQATVEIDALTGSIKNTHGSLDSQHILNVLGRIHEYCISEMATDKWDGRAGSNLGSPIVKQRLREFDMTTCLNADWEASVNKLNYGPENSARFRALFPAQTGDPCSADQLYHYTGSGVGSWVSNIGNILHAADIQGTTIGFRAQRPNDDGTTPPNLRYELMLGHQFPECTRALHSNESATALKTRIMVVPNQAERLCARSPCDYAAMKHFFSFHLWQSVVMGPLGGDMDVALGQQYEALRSAFRPMDGVAPRGASGNDNLPPYIGVHLRHKWEFKLTPPRVSQVAEVLRAIVMQLDPTQHSELHDATPAPNAGRHVVWGERPVVFCASDETDSCIELQTVLAEDDFTVLYFDNEKTMAKTNGITNYMTDVAMLEKSSVFVGTGSSNLGRWVNAIRGPAKLSMSLDVSFNAIHF